MASHQFKKSNLILAKYVLFILIGVAILVTIIIGENQYQDLKSQLVQQEKDSIKQVIESDLNEKVNKLNLIGTSIRGFYEGSHLVEPHEFAQFNEGIFENIPELKNTFILQGSKIIHSYPNSDFIGSDFDVLFPSAHAEIEGIMVGLLEFPINQELSIVLAIPFDYAVNKENIPKDRYKLIVYTPNLELILYQAESNKGQVLKQNVEFSQEELENSIQMIKQTNLLGYHSKKNVVLEYTLWYGASQQEFYTFERVIVLAGIIFSVLIPILLIRSQKLSNLLQKNTTKLERANTQLQETDKAKVEFSTMITHELKTPLSTIIGYGEMLKDPKMGELNKEQESAIDEICKSSTALETLIGNVLTAQKIELAKLTFNIEMTSVKVLLKKAHNRLLPLMLEKQIEFLTSTEYDAIITTDEEKMLQVFSNLVQNSVDFVPASGGRIKITCSNKNSNVLFSVIDNGSGMPKGKLKNLFTKYYQIDTSITRKHGGTGLGLPICKGIIKGLGGKIWVESEEGKGTIIYFTIPKKSRVI